MKKGLTEMVFILDRSGSMGGLEADTVGGFNAMIRKQKGAEGSALVTTVLFNEKVQILHDRMELTQVPLMTERDYSVGGCTALLDAVGGTIHHIAKIHRYSRPEDVPEHTVFVITTDGMENASCQYSAEEVRQMIGRIRKISPRHEKNLVIFLIPHRMTLASVLSLMQAGPQNLPGLCRIVIDALTVPPSVRGKEQGHGIELLSIRRRTVRIFTAVRCAGPGKIPLAPALSHKHIIFRPLPNPIKLLLHVQLHADHHAVGHPLGAGIIVSGIHQIAHILPHRMVDPLLLTAVKKDLYDILKLSVNLFLCNAEFRKYITIVFFLYTTHCCPLHQYNLSFLIIAGLPGKSLSKTCHMFIIYC